MARTRGKALEAGFSPVPRLFDGSRGKRGKTGCGRKRRRRATDRQLSASASFSSPSNRCQELTRAQSQGEATSDLQQQQHQRHQHQQRQQQQVGLVWRAKFVVWRAAGKAARRLMGTCVPVKIIHLLGKLASIDGLASSSQQRQTIGRGDALDCDWTLSRPLRTYCCCPRTPPALHKDIGLATELVRMTAPNP